MTDGFVMGRNRKNFRVRGEGNFLLDWKKPHSVCFIFTYDERASDVLMPSAVRQKRQC